jgi:hypothetical protein
MAWLFFGATRRDKLAFWRAFSRPISAIKCTKCAARSPVEYVAWEDGIASQADKEEAVALLTKLVEADHPHHHPVLCGALTLEELRRRAWGKPVSFSVPYSRREMEAPQSKTHK